MCGIEAYGGGHYALGLMGKQTFGGEGEATVSADRGAPHVRIFMGASHTPIPLPQDGFTQVNAQIHLGREVRVAAPAM